MRRFDRKWSIQLFLQCSSRLNEEAAVVFEALQPKLAPHDDRELRRTALSVLADEFAQRYAEESGRGVRAMVAGARSHWVRPHNSRWKAAGGFVYPALWIPKGSGKMEMRRCIGRRVERPC